jgi:glutamate synthase (NADPH/NADH) large chain
VRRLIENHRGYTGSARAAQILADWDVYSSRFIKVMPHAYAQVLDERLRAGEDLRVDLPPQPPHGHHLTTNDINRCREKIIPTDS